MMTLQQAIEYTARLLQSGQLAEAQRAAREIAQQAPAESSAWNMLGIVLAAVQEYDQADAAYRKALQLHPESLEAWSNWGLMLRAQGKAGDAAEYLERAARIAPDHAGVLCNLSTVLMEVGRLEEAAVAARRGIALMPNFPALHSGLILMLHYIQGTRPSDIAEELARWRTQFADPLRAEIKPHSNDRTRGRRLRVGYVSADFYHHSVARFMLPLLTSHDPAAVETFCYADLTRADQMTMALERAAHNWRPTTGMPDAAVADLIGKDQIDILMDLGMHTHGNRLLLFARKPAPIQATWLAYAGSTGLPTIEYRLSDPVLDSVGAPNPGYTEQTLHLETFWCYQPAAEAPAEVSSLPADRTGAVTFASLNMLAKVSPAALSTWAQILANIPNSTLLLHAGEGPHRQRLLEPFLRENVSADRIRFIPRIPMEDFLKLHNDIDILLDSFPFSGGTTTCDALWMGVPAITLRGNLAVGRGGASLLTTIGLPHLIAETPETYIQTAIGLATDLPRLRVLRAGLRDRMRQSALMDAPRFARTMEKAFRMMWHRHCQRDPAR